MSLRGGRGLGSHCEEAAGPDVIARRPQADEAISREAMPAAPGSRRRGDCFGPSGLAMMPVEGVAMTPIEGPRNDTARWGTPSPTTVDSPSDAIARGPQADEAISRDVMPAAPASRRRGDSFGPSGLALTSLASCSRCRWVETCGCDVGMPPKFKALAARPSTNPTPPAPAWRIHPAIAAPRTRTTPVCRRPAARRRCGASTRHRTRC